MKPSAISYVPVSEKREVALSLPLPSESFVPPSWLDRLLTTLLSAPRHTSRWEENLRPLLTLVTDVLGEDVSVAIRLPAGTADGTSLLVACGPIPPTPSFTEEPAPLFATETQEVVFSLEDAAGATFHATAGDPLTLMPGSVGAAFLNRVHAALVTTFARVQGEKRREKQATELQRLHERVMQSEKLASLGQFVAGVVHEINNPLGSIIAYTDYLLRKAEMRLPSPDGPDDDLERLRRISAATEQILRFSHELTAYARPSSGVTEPVALHEVINRALVFCEHILRRAGARVERDFTENLQPVRGTSSELIQVFVNLITNACHAMRESGGAVLLQTRTDGMYVRVAVIDNGYGIAQQHLGQIFEPFFTTKSEGQGTGLGLSIVHNIVRRHGGTIRAESRPGDGTEFTVTLPVLPSP